MLYQLDVKKIENGKLPRDLYIIDDQKVVVKCEKGRLIISMR